MRKISGYNNFYLYFKCRYDKKKKLDVLNLKILFMFIYFLFIENCLILILFFVLLISNNNNFFKLLKNVCILIVEIVLKLFIELLI